MTTSILLVGHGSRNIEGNREIEKFSTLWRQLNPQWRIETCFIEFADPLLDGGLDAAAKGASRVIVAPLILNAAGHVKMEIPHHIAKARLRHPEIDFIYTPHLGTNEQIFTVLKRSLRSVMQSMAMSDPKTTAVILLGRGSSDRIANGEVAKMARWLFEESDHEQVDIAFTGITSPRLESVVQRQTTLGATQIAILPYYLFTGTLIERIKQQVNCLQQNYPHITIKCGHYFGFEDEISQLLNQRVKAALGKHSGDEISMMECDGCQYRQHAEDEGHGHHHEHEHHYHTEHI